MTGHVPRRVLVLREDLEIARAVFAEQKATLPPCDESARLLNMSIRRISFLARELRIAESAITQRCVTLDDWSPGWGDNPHVSTLPEPFGG